jgi:multisubunit Na+/H+ antiporter MnhG subunit
MTPASIVIGVLLALAVAIALVAATASAALIDPLERLHMTSLVVSLSAGLIGAAVWLDESDWQARIKAALVVLLLFAMNSILTHATARSVRIRGSGHWGPQSDEEMPIVGRDVQSPAAQEAHR